jgi:hypothetical protein
LTACSDHTEAEPEQPEVQTGEPLRLAALTRTDTDNASDPMAGKIVNLFLVSQQENYPQESGSVTYNGKDDTTSDIVWNPAPLMVKPGRDYFIFGFMPAPALLDPEPKPVPSVSDIDATHATMTITNLPAVSDKDYCIVTGVKAGRVTGSIAAGSFGYHAPEDTDQGYDVSLLVDHVYAAVEFRIVIDAEYNQLRTIKPRQMVLNSIGRTALTVDISLAMNSTGTNPISDMDYDITDTREGSVTLYAKSESESVALQENDDDAIVIKGYFAVPDGYAQGMYVESTYDVYDKKGNMIDEGRVAINSLKSILSNLQRGQKKVVYLTVNPSYLYILSNDDVDK